MQLCGIILEKTLYSSGRKCSSFQAYAFALFSTPPKAPPFELINNSSPDKYAIQKVQTRQHIKKEKKGLCFSHTRPELHLRDDTFSRIQKALIYLCTHASTLQPLEYYTDIHIRHFWPSIFLDML